MEKKIYLLAISYGIVLSNIASAVLEERECSPFAFQYKLLESFVRLEHSVTTLKNQVNMLQEHVDKNQGGDNSNRNVIAFTAVLDHEKEFKEGDTLKFNKVLYNAGNGYDCGTGVFTAPISGTYIFAFQIEHWKEGKIIADLMLENVLQCSVVINTGGKSTQSSGNVVIALEAGNSVWIKTSNGVLYGRDTLYGTAFSGAYLY